MFLGIDIRVWDQMVVLGLEGSNGDFAIQDLRCKETYKNDFQATPERSLCLVVLFHYELAPLRLLTASTTLPSVLALFL